MLLEKPKTNGHATVEEPTPETKPHKQVRLADPRDFSEVCRLLLLAHAEAGMFPADNEKVAYHVDRFLRGPWGLLPATMIDHRGEQIVDPGPRGVIGVIGDPGGPPRTIEGLVMLGLGAYWYTKTMHIDEYIMFIDPGYRKGTHHAQMLIEWQKHQAEVNKMPLITGILSNDRTIAKCRLLNRYLTKIGEFFTHLPEGYKFESDALTGPGRAMELTNGRRREGH